MIIDKKVKSKTVYGFYLEYKDEFGKRVQIKKFGNSKWKKAEAEVQEAIEKARIDKINETILKTKDGSLKTLSDVFNEYISENREKPLKEVSIYDITNFVNKHILIDKLKDIKMKDITVETIIGWQKELLTKKIAEDNRSQKGGQLYSNAQLRKIQTYFKSILEYACKHEYIEKNPFEKVNIAQRVEGVKEDDEYKFINIDEFWKLYDVIQKNPNEERRLQDTVIFSILFWVGLRKNELVALNCGDYNVQEKRLKINKSWNNKQFILTTPKTDNSIRSLKVVDEVHDAITNLINYYRRTKIYDDKLPLITNNGKLSQVVHDVNSGRLASTTLDRYRDQYFEKAGLNVIRIHDFRHSCATYLLNSGQEMFQVARYLGDTVATLEKVYAHVEKKVQDDMIGEINKNNREYSARQKRP